MNLCERRQTFTQVFASRKVNPGILCFEDATNMINFYIAYEWFVLGIRKVMI